MLNRFNQVMDQLVVYTERMTSNIWFTKGLVFAQPLMLALTGKGMPREEAYALVEGLALQVNPQRFITDKGAHFQDLVMTDKHISELLTIAEREEIFDHSNKLPYIDEVFARFDFSQLEEKK